MCVAKMSQFGNGRNRSLYTEIFFENQVFTLNVIYVGTMPQLVQIFWDNSLIHLTLKKKIVFSSGGTNKIILSF